jgi:hypothetical protein
MTTLRAVGAIQVVVANPEVDSTQGVGAASSAASAIANRDSPLCWRLRPRMVRFEHVAMVGQRPTRLYPLTQVPIRQADLLT